MRQNATWALALTGLISLSVAGNAAIVYQESFPNTTGTTTGSNTAFSSVGWNAHITSSATSLTTDVTTAVISNVGGIDAAGGYGAKTTTAPNGIGLYWTTELSPVPQASVTTLSFYSNNGNTTDALRFAIRLDNNTPGNTADDVWFATDTGFIRNSSTPGVAGNWVANGELESFAFTTAGSAWRDLTFTPGSTLVLSATARSSALPAGDINGVGIFASLASSITSANGGVVRFDNFAIDAIPEPSTWLSCFGLVTGYGIWRRRRRV